MEIQLLKDPYNFDFLTLTAEAQERDLERGLLEHLRQFLLELGVGFAFVGSQYPIEVAGEDFRIDLLFYHLRLRCFVVLDLKMGPFKPEYTGKMNFYLSAVDDQLKNPADHPSIGIILCKAKNQVIVEYVPYATHPNRWASPSSGFWNNYPSSSKGAYQQLRNWKVNLLKVT